MENVDLADAHQEESRSSPLKFQHTRVSPAERQQSRADEEATHNPFIEAQDVAVVANKHGSVEIPATENPLAASRRAPPPPSAPTTVQPPPSDAEAASAAPAPASPKTAPSSPKPPKQERGAHVASLRSSAVKSKENLPSLGGLNSVVKAHVEVPAEVLARLLLKDEAVVAQFDVLYPDLPAEASGWRPRTLTRLILCTLGLFQVLLWLRACFHFVRHLLFDGCCEEGCSDRIAFVRGKLVITSFGRVLHWTQAVTQAAQWLDQRDYHSVEQQTQLLHVDDLAQINLHYSDHYLGGCDESAGGCGCLLSCCRCGRDFETGVDLLFFGYGADARTDHSAFVTPEPAQRFVDRVNRACVGGGAEAVSVATQVAPGHGMLAACVAACAAALPRCVVDALCGLQRAFPRLAHTTFADVAYARVSGAAAAQPAPVRIRIVSDGRDHVCAGEYGQEPLEDVAQLHARLIAALTNSRGQRFQSLHKARLGDTRPSAANAENFAPVFVAASNTLGQVGIAVDGHKKRESASYSVEHGERNGGGALKHALIPGVKDICEELHSFTLVDDDLQVTLPTRWLPLAPQETVLAAAGQFYRPSGLDAALSVATLGLYYLLCVAPRLTTRVALVLTTHRLVEISLTHRKHRVPPELGALDVAVRSFLPQHVAAGCVASHAAAGLTADAYHVSSSLLTAFGALTVTLRGTQLSFAQQLQLTVSRLDTVSLTGPSHLETQFLPELMHLAPPDAAQSADGHGHGDAAQPPLGPSSVSLLTLKAKHEDRNLSAHETQLLPLVPGETLLHRFQSGLLYQPNGCCAFRRDASPHYHAQLCGAATRPLHDPGAWCCCSAAQLLRSLSCGGAPRVSSAAAVLTDHTLLYAATVHSLRSLAQQAVLYDPHQSVHLSRPGDGGGAGDSGGALDAVLGETEVDLLRCFAGSAGPKTRFKLQPFMVCWVPVRSLAAQSISVTQRGAKPYALHPLCTCCSQPSSYAARYTLLLRCASGLVLPFAEDAPFHNWSKDLALTRFQDALAALQLLSKVDQLA